MKPASIRLGDQRVFKPVSGLWSGTRGPLVTTRVIRSTDFCGDGRIVYESSAMLQVDSDQFEARRLSAGDIIVERSGGGPKQPVGRVALFLPPDEQPYCCGNFTTAIRVVDRDLFESAFVAFYLHHLYLVGDTEALQRGSTGIRNLAWSEYLDFEIPLWPRGDQQSICQLLRLAQDAYVVEQQLVKKADATKRATANLLFMHGLRGHVRKESQIGPIPSSWDCVQFGEVREWLQYGTSARCTVERAKYPVLRIPNIGGGHIDSTDLKYCDLEDEEAASYALKDGDLLFVRTNGVLERLGSCAVYSGAPAGALFASYLIRARLRPVAVPRFLAYFLGSDLGTQLIAGRATPAADGKYNLNTAIIDSLPVPLPPTREEQDEIVSIIDAVDKKIEIHRKKHDVLINLFKSLLHKLMTGDVRASDLDLSALQTAKPIEVTV